jgi:nucleotide-binding universal stress UspA family protein
MKIILATDGSSCNEAAVSEVQQNHWPDGTEVMVLSVVEPAPPLMGGPWMPAMDSYGEVEKIETENAQRVTESVVGKLRGCRGPKLSVTSSVQVGSPKRIIVEAATDWNADLIVLGSHGYKMWERILLGSVSSAVAQHAPCSVLIARERSK